MEFEQATQGAQARPRTSSPPTIEPELEEARPAARTSSKREQATGKYAGAKAKLNQLRTRLRRRRAGQDLRQERSRRGLLLPPARRVRARRGRRGRARSSSRTPISPGGRKRADEMLRRSAAAQPASGRDARNAPPARKRSGATRKRADQIDEALGGASRQGARGLGEGARRRAQGRRQGRGRGRAPEARRQGASAR